MKRGEKGRINPENYLFYLFGVFIQDNTLQYLNIATTVFSENYIKPGTNNIKINKKAKIETKN